MNANKHSISRWAITLHQSEDGAAYTLSYVFVIPFLMLLVALLVESSMLMSAKLGTVKAAYSAARTLSVQSTFVSQAEARSRAETEARRSMVPFASGITENSSSNYDHESDLLQAYNDWNDDPASQFYFSGKTHDAFSALKVDIDQYPSTWDAPIKISVTYEFPFRVPGVGKLLGKRKGNGYVLPIESTVLFHNDGPQNQSQDLGIGYGRE